MNTFDKFIHAVSIMGSTPSEYGLFHFLCIFIVLSATILLCIFGKNLSEKPFRVLVAVLWAVMASFEIYKQLICSMKVVDGVAVWKYAGDKFPFQLCSTPLYVLPFVAFLKDCKFRDRCISFIMTFSLFGGLCAYILPDGNFSTMIGLNIQTMLHHGIQIVLGVYFAVYFRKKMDFKFFTGSIVVFIGASLVAIGLNLTVPNWTDSWFNMFYIGPNYACPLPLLDKIYPAVPWIVFVLIYEFGFILISLLIYLIFKFFFKLYDNVQIKKRKAS